MDYSKAIRDVEAKIKRQEEALAGSKQLLEAIREASRVQPKEPKK